MGAAFRAVMRKGVKVEYERAVGTAKPRAGAIEDEFKREEAVPTNVRQTVQMKWGWGG